jgi:hypothetical protein
MNEIKWRKNWAKSMWKNYFPSPLGSKLSGGLPSLRNETTLSQIRQRYHEKVWAWKRSEQGQYDEVYYFLRNAETKLEFSSLDLVQIRAYELKIVAKWRTPRRTPCRMDGLRPSQLLRVLWNYEFRKSWEDQGSFTLSLPTPFPHASNGAHPPTLV